MILSIDAQAFEARKNWIARLIRARVERRDCNLGPAVKPRELPPGQRSYGYLRAYIDDALTPGLPGMRIGPPSFARGGRVPCERRR